MLDDAKRLELIRLLRLAKQEMASRGTAQIWSNFERCDALASFLENAATKIAAKDDSDALVLWRIFAPTCDWDDAGGSQNVGNSIFELIGKEWLPSKMHG